MGNQRKAILLALAAVCLWSTVTTAFKLSLAMLEPLQLVAYASLFATMILLIRTGLQGGWNRLWRLFRHQPHVYLLLGFLNPFLYYSILLKAYDLLPAQQAQSINYTWAITLGLLSASILGRQYGYRDAVAALLGYFGVLVIATRGDFAMLKFDSTLGVSLALASTLVWSAFWIINTRLKAEPLPGMCLCFVCGTPIAFTACALFSEITPVTATALAGAAYIGLFEMGVTYVIWLAALKAADNIARISNLIFISPFLSLPPITLILGEPIAAATPLGLALIMAGILVQQYARKSNYR